mmetsp:Transcript_25831/g.37003  ORF Transcript_25831/g.37003 Transcript_25831/m.37003 type:complete len:482 (-) Transcript_25831:27-1472(-)
MATSSSEQRTKDVPVKAEDEAANAKSKKSKPVNPDIVIPTKKAALSKAERRALQEKQRAEKAVRQSSGGAAPPTTKSSAPVVEVVHENAVHKDVLTSSTSVLGSDAKSGNKLPAESDPTDRSNTVQLFGHLPPYNNIVRSCSVSLETQVAGVTMHPHVLRLAIQYRDGVIRGANKRCKAMMRTFQVVIQEYEKTPEKLLSQDLDALLKNAFTFLTKHSRPHSTSMGNAFTFLKIAIANLARDTSVEDAKVILCDQIDAYIRERITFADEAISNYAVTKIQDGDVILIYAKSEVVHAILKKAFLLKRKFRVIVVDSRPLCEGRETLSELLEVGIQCTYILLNTVSYVMKEVTKVFLGAAALMSDGSVQSRVGTYGVAILAQSCNVPVLVCCETYKISNRVQLESITGNELGNPDVGVASTAANVQLLRHWRTTPNLKLLNIMYDLTPSEFVSGIVTEMGILPPTSVAVILREMNPQDNNYNY